MILGVNGEACEAELKEKSYAVRPEQGTFEVPEDVIRERLEASACFNISATLLAPKHTSKTQMVCRRI
jgi:hypothetical protein